MDKVNEKENTPGSGKQDIVAPCTDENVEKRRKGNDECHYDE